MSETGIWNDDEQIDDFRIIRGDLSRNDAYVEIKIKVFNNDEVIKEWRDVTKIVDKIIYEINDQEGINIGIPTRAKIIKIIELGGKDE